MEEAHTSYIPSTAGIGHSRNHNSQIKSSRIFTSIRNRVNGAHTDSPSILIHLHGNIKFHVTNPDYLSNIPVGSIPQPAPIGSFCCHTRHPFIAINRGVENGLLLHWPIRKLRQSVTNFIYPGRQLHLTHRATSVAQNILKRMHIMRPSNLSSRYLTIDQMLLDICPHGHPTREISLRQHSIRRSK